MSGVPIPDDIKVKISIKQGSVYYFRHEDFPDDLHYFVVLNKNPLDDDYLLLSVASSQIERKKEFIKQRNLPEATLVIVERSDYKHFSKDTVFNCNTVHTVSLDALIERVSEENRFFLDLLPSEIVENIIKGVINSPLIEGVIKKQLE